jgi:hypothetical protein
MIPLTVVNIEFRTGNPTIFALPPGMHDMSYDKIEQRKKNIVAAENKKQKTLLTQLNNSMNHAKWVCERRMLSKLQKELRELNIKLSGLVECEEKEQFTDEIMELTNALFDMM